MKRIQTDPILMEGERIIRRGGNAAGSWVVICTLARDLPAHHWRVWTTDDNRQTYAGLCDCEGN